MIELERTFLAKHIPSGIEKCKSMNIIDIYIPQSAAHPVLRIRKRGERLVITKKKPVVDDASHQEEQTIVLTKEEFEEIRKISGKVVQKVRYYYPWNGRTAEIDIFTGALTGLVLIDFEFETAEDKDSFEPPDFCLADVTREEFIAGGMLCGKSYEDIKHKLEKFRYGKLKI